MTARVLLVRHTEVAQRWTPRCYGRTDVGLSRMGTQAARELATRLARGLPRDLASERVSEFASEPSTNVAREPVTAVIHSGLRRAAYLAERVAALTRLDPIIDPRWQERDFAAWEGRTWNAIWRETGNEMDRMLSEPNDYRPGGGETTAELVQRSVAAWHGLPNSGVVVVITHGGPIAAVRAMLAHAPLSRLAQFTIPKGACVAFEGGAEQFTSSEK